MNKNLIQLLALIGIAAPLSGADLQYQLIKEIPVPGEGACNRLAIDETTRSLYVPHGTQIDVVDLGKEQIVGQITNLPPVHDLVLAPRFARAFASNPGTNFVSVIDLRKLKPLSKLGTPKRPGLLLLDDRGLLYCFNTSENSATMFEADDSDLVGTLTLEHPARSAVAMPRGQGVFCAVPDKNEIAAIDPILRKVRAKHPTAPGEGPSAVAYDPGSKQLLIGCSNKLMIMMNPTNGHVTASVPIGQGVTGCVIDPRAQLAVCCAEDGTLTFIRVSTSGLSVIQTLKSEPGLRAIAINDTAHKFYVANGQQEALKILVYGMTQSGNPAEKKGS